MAISRPPIARNRLLLCPQLRTLPRTWLTSVVDPKEKSTIFKEPERWSLTTLRDKPIRISAKAVRQATTSLSSLQRFLSLLSSWLRACGGLTDSCRTRCRHAMSRPDAKWTSAAGSATVSDRWEMRSGESRLKSIGRALGKPSWRRQCAIRS